MTEKKKEQLKMNPGTAQHRLLKDILWSLLLETNKNVCCKCGKQMCRSTYSIEHLEPWLDSKDPVGLFFDIKNISFSHLKCNLSSARKYQKWENREDYKEHFKKKDAERQRNAYTTEKRRAKYNKEKLKKE